MYKRAITHTESSFLPSVTFQSAIQSASKVTSKHTGETITKKKKQRQTPTDILKELGTDMKSQKHASHTGMCTYTSIQQSHTHTYIVTNMSSSYPINIKRKQAVVIRAPRLDGDNMPSMATTLSHKHTKTPLVISVFSHW